MSYLNQVVSGGQSTEGHKIIISSMEGIGKTTLACQAPNSLLVPLENGYKSITTARLPNTLQQWNEVESFLKEFTLAAQRGLVKKGTSLVWDSVTALERIINAETLYRDEEKNKRALGKAHSMETSHGGYGKAYAISRDLFGVWLDYNSQLAQYASVNIIVTCHAFVTRVMDPSAGEYDTFDLLLHSPKNNKTYGNREYLTQWADLIGFLHKPMYVSKNKDEKISRGVDANQGRVFEVERSPAWVAKNRYDLTTAIQIPKNDGWNHIADAIYKSKGYDLYNRALVPTKEGT